jgi:hypothetical protein
VLVCYHNRAQLEPALRSSSTLTILEPHAGRALDKVVLFHQRWRQFAKKNADQVSSFCNANTSNRGHHLSLKPSSICVTTAVAVTPAR